jgi:hypothetical protein
MGYPSPSGVIMIRRGCCEIGRGWGGADPHCPGRITYAQPGTFGATLWGVVVVIRVVSEGWLVAL